MTIDPLIVETGTGLGDADSYCSIAFADSYHANRGNDDWDGLSNDEKSIALRKATDYIEQMYRQYWKGDRTNSSQSLSWPRYGVVIKSNNSPFSYYGSYGFYNNITNNAIPNEIQQACALMALKAIQADAEDLNPDLEQQIVREKIGPIDTTYQPYSPQYKRFRAVDQLLKPFLESMSNVRIVRS